MKIKNKKRLIIIISSIVLVIAVILTIGFTSESFRQKRVINNIIGNSVKYMDKRRGIINFRIQDQYDCIQIEIEDNGKGVAKNEISYIFDRFYRTDASRNSAQGGTGLGLSICRKIIEDHGGRIWASSKEGVGTSIFFTLKKYNKEYMEYKEDIVNE